MQLPVLVISCFRELCMYLKITQYVIFPKSGYKYWKKKILSLQSAEFLLQEPM